MKWLCDKYLSIRVNFFEHFYLTARLLQFSAKLALFIGMNIKLAEENARSNKEEDCIAGDGDENKYEMEWKDAKWSVC